MMPRRVEGGGGPRRVGGNTNHVWLAVAVVFIVHVVTYRATAQLRSEAHRGHSTLVPSLSRRSLDSPLVHTTSILPSSDSYTTISYSSSDTQSDETRVAYPSSHQHPNETTPPHAPTEQSGALLDYKQIYETSSPRAQPFVLAAMVIWLCFLFAFVGITASDFFCPNLSTIASRLGMSESVTGVTFLAFSNGSPDVFSTFSSLRANSGSLAIGELIGAASFIVSVVAGTMCFIQPFQVARRTFLRDVGFFTVAVAFTFTILWDQHIRAWEAAAMVVLYVIYVLFVAFGSWWSSRKERREDRIRKARDEYAIDDGTSYRDDDMSPRSTTSTAPTPGTPPLLTNFPSPILSPSLHHPHTHASLDPLIISTLTARGTPITITRKNSSTSSSNPLSPTARRAKSRSTVRSSLLGAIEFRDVVNSLQADSTARTLAVFGAVGEEGHTHANVRGGTGRNSKSVGNTPRKVTRHLGGAKSMGSVREWESASDADHAHWEEAGRVTEEEEDEEVGGREEELAWVDLSSGVENPWGAVERAAELRIPLPRRKSSAASARSLRSPRMENGGDYLPLDSRKVIRRVPSILLTTAAGDESTVLEASTTNGGRLFSFRQRRGYRISRAVFLALFPSLQDFGRKSWVGRATAVLCVPAILVLNLTLPVVDSDEDDCDAMEEKEGCGEEGDEEDEEDEEEGEEEGGYRDDPSAGASDTPPHRRTHSDNEYVARSNRRAIAQEFHSHVMPRPETSPWETLVDIDGVDRGLRDFEFGGSRSRAEREAGEVEEGGKSPPGTPVDLVVDEDVLTRWLTAVQCILGPVFIVTALSSDDLHWYQPVSALGVGIIMASLAFYHFEDHRHRGRIVLCFVGFLVAMVWILMIVTEVVGILQTFGHVFGLSDAVLGLTVFAMGNSLGDLVANATVARMGFPAMAIAACFGGPMLNILLGIGCSGSYIIWSNGGEPYHVEIGRTLLVSNAGLLCVLIATLIAVPLNDYWMSKRLGAMLIAAYVVVLTCTVWVEILS